MIVKECVKTACLGFCGLTPVMVICGDVYARLTTDKIPEIFKKR